MADRIAATLAKQTCTDFTKLVRKSALVALAKRRHFRSRCKKVILISDQQKIYRNAKARRSPPLMA